MIEENFSLKQYNTFGIDATAKYFSTFNTVDELRELLEDRLLTHNSSLITILGGGSNVLLTKNIEGLVLKNEVKGIEKIGEDESYVYVKAGAGENWHQLVTYCLDNNFAGLENLSLIPGNVGASPMQNIGAYGVELKDVFYELEAFHLADKKVVKFTLPDCRFGYRESIFKKEARNQFVLISVTYRLNKVPRFNIGYGAVEQELEAMCVEQLSIQAISQAIIRIRRSKLPDPAIIGNAGSFFKNPEISAAQFKILKTSFENIVGYTLDTGNIKLAAGWLIEQCGWKGYRKGDAGCHAKQALVLVNYGHASGSEILALSEAIIASVKTKFNVSLEREVNIF